MNLFSLAQTLAPQQTLSQVAGFFAKSENPYIKKAFIRSFVKAYGIRLDDYEIQNTDDFRSFNDFFTRKLKEGKRSIDPSRQGIACPADGTVSQIGRIEHGQILQAKGRDYDVGQLLADFEQGKDYADGAFATIYLAPTNYHRVHMPCDARLVATRYVPGTLFSVNNSTAKNVPDLFARNERLICDFDTEFGRMSVVLVGAMIVAGISSVATGDIKRTPYIQQRTHDLMLKKGDELGQFYLGSTVIILLPKSAGTTWLSEFSHDTKVLMGQKLGEITQDG